MSLPLRARRTALRIAAALATLAALPGVAQTASFDGAPVRSLREEWASQLWDLTARFESGHRLFVRFAVSNAGLGDQNGAASWQIVTPQGRVLEFHNGRRRARWSLSPDALRMEMGSSLLDQHGPALRLRLDKRSAKLDLVFSLGAPALETDGLGDRYGAQLLALASPISGSLWIEGMDSNLAVRGQLALTYSWMREREPALEARRIEFFSLDPIRPIYLLDVETPEGTHRSCQVLREPDRAGRRAQPASLCVCGGPPTRDGYPLPRALEPGGATLEGRIEIAKPLVRYDPLMPLPRFFRWLLRAAMRPLRVWATSPYDLLVHRQGRPATRIRGTGITSLSFPNPISESSSTPLADFTGVCRCASAS